MENIFMTDHGILRQLTINCSPGISTKITDRPRLVHWAPILKALRHPNEHTWLRVDYWTDSRTKARPLLDHYCTPNFDVIPGPSGQLFSATIIPSNLVFELAEPDHPEMGIRIDALSFRLSTRCNGTPKEWSTCGIVHIFPTGQLEIVAQ